MSACPLDWTLLVYHKTAPAHRNTSRVDQSLSCRRTGIGAIWGTGRGSVQHPYTVGHHRLEPKPACSAGFGLLSTLLGKRTCKPNSVVCGHSSRRRVAADAHQRPTRRFRHLHEAPSDEDLSPGTPLEPPGRIGPMRSAAWLHRRRFPPYLVLLRVGFTLPPVSRPERCALTAPFHPYPGAAPACWLGVALDRIRRNGGGVAEAVSFLWHWPSVGF
jgi:hypothetical protein